MTLPPDKLNALHYAGPSTLPKKSSAAAGIWAFISILFQMFWFVGLIFADVAARVHPSGPIVFFWPTVLSFALSCYDLWQRGFKLANISGILAFIGSGTIIGIIVIEFARSIRW